MSQPTALLLADASGHADLLAASADALVANDPFAASRRIGYADERFAAGVTTLQGTLEVAGYPLSEMLVVHRGELAFTVAGETMQVGRGDSLVIAAGTAFSVQASGDALWAWFADIQPEGDAPPALTLLDCRAHLNPSSPPDDQILIGPAPQCRANNLFEAGALRIGVWDSTPYERRSRGHLCHELMQVIEGSVTLRLDDGELQVNAGDTVFVPKGAACAWVSTQYVRKFYAVS
ncbi:cupin domain-containing protein [Pseudomonas putida]